MLRYDLSNTPEIDWLAVCRTNAVMTWLMPRVAMKLLTFNFTTKKPLMKPATAQANRAMKMPTIGETVWFLASVVVMTSDIDINAPMDRS